MIFKNKEHLTLSHGFSDSHVTPCSARELETEGRSLKFLKTNITCWYRWQFLIIKYYLLPSCGYSSFFLHGLSNRILYLMRVGRAMGHTERRGFFITGNHSWLVMSLCPSTGIVMPIGFQSEPTTCYQTS